MLFFSDSLVGTPFEGQGALPAVTHCKDRDRSVAERYGFLLEHWDFLAERNGWTQLSYPIIPPDEYDVAPRTLFEVFQYFIGNTDWSFAFPPPDEDDCCHYATCP